MFGYTCKSYYLSKNIKTVRPLSVRMIFADNHNWDVYSLANKDILRDVEITKENKNYLFLPIILIKYS